jgi:PAS domain S-box-containing protein
MRDKNLILPQTVTALNKIFASIGNPNDFLELSVKLIQQNFDYDYVNLFLLNRSQQTLTLQAAAWKVASPQPEDFIKVELGQGLVGRAATTGHSLLVNDVSKDANFVPHPALPQVKAQLATPLIAGSAFIGVLTVESNQVDSLSKIDQDAIQTIADYMAMTIENTRLKNNQQRFTREQALIYESIVKLGTGLDTETVLTLMSQKITEALDAGACLICQIDKDANTITPLTEYVLRHPGNPPHSWRKVNTPLHISKDPITQQLFKTKRPVINRANDKGSTRQVWQKPAGQQDSKLSWHVVLALPLEIENHFTGLVEIYDKNPYRTFSSEDIQICRILATQTMLALERARLFHELLSRLSEVSMLYTLAQKLSTSLNLQDMLNTIVTSLRQVMGCRACCIFLLDDEHEQLEIKAADGLKPHWQKAAKLRLGEGAAGQAAAENRTVYLPDTHLDPTFIFFDEEVRSLMVVPLIAHGEVIGTINIDHNRPEAFGPTQERLLTIAAAQAGIAIANARLFTKVSAEQQQTQAIIQHMADGLLLLDRQGIIKTCNFTLANMLGLHRGQIIGQSVYSPNLPQNLAGITASTTHRARTGVLATEVYVETPRPRILQVFATTVVDDQQDPIGEVRLVHDVTKERELEQLKDDFFSTVSHELRTPLFSIQGFAQLMLEEDDLDKKTQQEFLETIRRQASQLAEMVNNLLDISKLDEGKLVLEKMPVVLGDVISQTILKLQGFAHQEKIKLVSNLSVQLPTIQGDKQRLEQVLTNLIGNAIKFSKSGDNVIISASANDANILVQVKDNGVGIPEEDLESIFSRYYQAGNKSERSAMGSGLGLHIAKTIVEGHGGKIWAESVAGQGSTFFFTLPISPN